MQPLQDRIINKFDNYFGKGDVITRRIVQDQLEVSFITAKKLIIHMFKEKRIVGKTPTLETSSIEYTVLK